MGGSCRAGQQITIGIRHGRLVYESIGFSRLFCLFMDIRVLGNHRKLGCWSPLLYFCPGYVVRNCPVSLEPGEVLTEQRRRLNLKRKKFSLGPIN